MALRIKNSITIDQVVRGVLLFLFLGGILWYLFYQSQNLIRGPRIMLSDALGTVHHERLITIEGSAENITHLTLNGKEIHTDQAGRFEETLVLENGYTIMTLGASDRYGRTISLSKPLVYVPETTIH